MEVRICHAATVGGSPRHFELLWADNTTSHSLQREREATASPALLQSMVVTEELPAGGLAKQILFPPYRCRPVVCVCSAR